MQRELLKGPLRKARSEDIPAKEAASTNVDFQGDTQEVPKVVVFNSSRVPEPFLDSVLLEKIRKRQRESEKRQ